MIAVSNQCKSDCESSSLRYKEYIRVPDNNQTLSGTTINLSDNINDINDVKIKGYFKQTQYSGRQLYNVNSRARVDSEVSVDSDNWITINYNNSDNSERTVNCIMRKSNLVQPNQNYLIVTEIESISGNGELYVNYGYTASSFPELLYSSNVLSNGDVKFDILTSRSDASSSFYSLATLVKIPAGNTFSVKFRLSILADTTITQDNFVYEPYTGGVAVPNVDNPQNIETVQGNVIITSTKGNQSSQITYNLSNNELTGYDYIKDNKLYKYTGKINSYNGETITGDYISTTGGLDNGATVYYKLQSPQQIEISKSGSLSVYGEDTIISSNIQTEMELICNANIKIEIRGKLSANAFNDRNFIGTFNLKSLSFETENDVDYKEKEFEYYKQVNNEAFKIGTFITTEVEDSDTNEVVKVTAMDYGLKFATPYETSLDYDSGEITMQDVLDEILTNVNIQLSSESQTLRNGNFIVDSNQFVNSEVYGDVISAIAGINGMFAIITDEDKLKFLTTEETNEVIEDYTELDDKRDTHPITIVQLGMSQVQGVSVEARWEAGVTQYGEHYLILNDNPFAYTMEKRQQLAGNILEQVKGLGYSSFESKFAFKPYLQRGDAIKFRNKAGELIDSIILKVDTDYENITLSAPSIADATVDYTVTDTEEKIRRAEVLANQANANVTIVSNQVTEIGQTVESNYQQLSENFSNYYTVEQTDEMIINAETGVTNTFSEAGGNNILRNTGLWFLEEKDINKYLYPTSLNFPSNNTYSGALATYEFWKGNAKKESNDNASNNTSIILQNGAFSQEQIVPNGNYTISFKYQLLNPFAIVKVKINDAEYSLDSEQITDFEQIINVITKSIKIEFITNMDDSAEIYDLMCNAGSVKLAYSQNENETTTDTVNISKGITITSTNMETIFKANANGIRILTLTGNVIAYFTDKGLSTKELIVENEAQIVKTLWQEVGDQTWITRM